LVQHGTGMANAHPTGCFRRKKGGTSRGEGPAEPASHPSKSKNATAEERPTKDTARKVSRPLRNRGRKYRRDWKGAQADPGFLWHRDRSRYRLFEAAYRAGLWPEAH